MNKIKTLKMNYEFKNVFSKGKFFVNDQIIIYIKPNNFDFNRIGIAVGTKCGKAVKRNHVKRLIRECYYKYMKDLKISYDIVFVWNKKCNIEDASYYKILGEMEKTFLKTGIL